MRTRIREYGLLANRTRTDKLARCSALFGAPPVDTEPASSLVAPNCLANTERDQGTEQPLQRWLMRFASLGQLARCLRTLGEGIGYSEPRRDVEHGSDTVGAAVADGSDFCWIAISDLRRWVLTALCLALPFFARHRNPSGKGGRSLSR